MKKIISIVLGVLILTACSSPEKKGLKRMIEFDQKMIVEINDSIQAREARNEAFAMKLKAKETRLKKLEETIVKQDCIIDSLDNYIYKKEGMNYLFNRKR